MKPDRHDWLLEASEADRARLANWLTETECAGFDYNWNFWGRESQQPPPGLWRNWLIMAGRGFGKTRAGSEWVRRIAEENPDARIALVSATLGEARAVMVEGESGIIACTPPDNAPQFDSSLRRLRFPNGALAFTFSAAEPESLRGPQFSHAWCDEIGKWPLAHDRATQSWDNLMLGLRLGRDQRTMVTTTPRSVPLLRRLLDGEAKGTTVVTRGTTRDNAANLPLSFIEAIETEYGGTQLARQEIDGQLIDDLDGALWTRTLIEQSRECPGRVEGRRTVVAVDPPASSHGDECGIIVASLGEDGLARILADCSIERASPERWAMAVANAARQWGADRVIAEANQGGAMVESVLRAADQTLPVKLVRASQGKSARAEPVAALYEASRVRHVAVFAQLEDQLCGMMAGGEYLGPGRSPDRADALVWALSELMLNAPVAPRVTRF